MPLFEEQFEPFSNYIGILRWRVEDVVFNRAFPRALTFCRYDALAEGLRFWSRENLSDAVVVFFYVSEFIVQDFTGEDGAVMSYFYQFCAHSTGQHEAVFIRDRIDYFWRHVVQDVDRPRDDTVC